MKFNFQRPSTLILSYVILWPLLCYHNRVDYGDRDQRACKGSNISYLAFYRKHLQTLR